MVHCKQSICVNLAPDFAVFCDMIRGFTYMVVFWSRANLSGHASSQALLNLSTYSCLQVFNLPVVLHGEFSQKPTFGQPVV